MREIKIRATCRPDMTSTRARVTRADRRSARVGLNSTLKCAVSFGNFTKADPFVRAQRDDLLGRVHHAREEYQGYHVCSEYLVDFVRIVRIRLIEQMTDARTHAGDRLIGGKEPGLEIGRTQRRSEVVTSLGQ